MNNSIRKLILFWLRQLLHVFIAYGIAVFITYLIVGGVLFDDFSKLIPNTLFGFFLSYFLWKGNAIIGWLVNRRFPWEENPIKTFKASVISSIVYTIIIVICIYWFSIDFLFNGDFLAHFSHYISQILNVIVFSLFITSIFYLIYFFKWWRIAVVNEEKLVRESIQLRYEALKSQVNPHFLFNSLSVLSAIVDTDSQKAKQFIMHFSNIYRYVLDQREKELVPLSDEISFAKSFLNLNEIRHGDNLQIDIDMPNLHGFVVPLSLQMVLENCLKHNIVSSEKPLRIEIYREGDFVVVQNTLQKRKVLPSSNGIGMETLCKRYEHLSNRHVIISQSEGHYTVKIPILDSIELVN